ncbi:hypothetical protein C8Q74DRAFT_236920 [Fomes fomentarius]|nr:hypothetical protein C8Q74DRAFT_236920 [Fomes fomentarius]
MPSSDQTLDSAIMSPAPCLGRLPPEIIHIILNLLRKDKRALLSCARINKRWRGVALSHLFVELKYRASDSFDRLFDFLRGHPEIAGVVKKLHLYKKIERAKYRAPGGLSLLMVSDDYPLFDHATFVGLLPKMSNLRELILEDVGVYDEPLYPERAVRLPFVLRQLELRGNSSFAVLRKLFDRLEIGTIKFGSGSSLPKLRKSPAHTFAIPRLVVSREAAGLLIPLQRVIGLDSLRSLSVAVRFMNQMDALCALISKAGRALTHLDIDLVQPVSDLTHKRTGERVPCRVSVAIF